MTSVLVPERVLADVVKHGLSWPAGRERGGILLGYRKPGAIEITGLTLPGRWDRAYSTLFRRSERGHRIRALREWKASGHTVDWVGEWHTHPGGTAEPSSIDRRTWIELVRHTAKPMTFLIFDDQHLFVGLQNNGFGPITPLSLEDLGCGAVLFSPQAIMGAASQQIQSRHPLKDLTASTRVRQRLS